MRTLTDGEQVATAHGQKGVVWPLQDIRSLRVVCARSNVLSLPPPTCIAHNVAIRLHDYWAIYDLPSTSPLYAIHHKILLITISCEGQGVVRLVEEVDMPLIEPHGNGAAIIPDMNESYQFRSHANQREREDCVSGGGGLRGEYVFCRVVCFCSCGVFVCVTSFSSYVFLWRSHRNKNSVGLGLELGLRS